MDISIEQAEHPGPRQVRRRYWALHRGWEVSLGIIQV